MVSTDDSEDLQQISGAGQLTNWPTGTRDVTEFPTILFSFPVPEPDIDIVINKKHLEGFLKLDGVDASDWEGQKAASGLDFTPQRFRSYRKMYERIGLIYRQNDKLRLSALGREISELDSGLTESVLELLTTRRNSLVDRIRRRAISILSRDQLDNPTERQRDKLPSDCDVFPFRCIWGTMLRLDNKLHYQEINRVLLRVMKMSDLDAAIETIKQARSLDYNNATSAELDRRLGERVFDDQESARIASWFSMAGWGGLIIDRENDGNGFRHLISSAIPIVRRELSKPGLIFRATNEEEWFQYYLSDSLSQFGFVNLDNSHPLQPCLLAIKTKPFVLLAGLSGTGKSRLVRTLAFKTCWPEDLRTSKTKPGNFELIPVRPNWHDSMELMGYITRINGEKYVTTPFLKFIAKAWNYLDVPFFLCLDEMNLAPVEQYFAEYLSILETRHSSDGVISTDFIIAKRDFENPSIYDQIRRDLGLYDDARFIEGISIPSNLVVIGTVNMDETTHSFSRKVLDRAMTIEMNQVDLKDGLAEVETDWNYPDAFIPPNSLIGKYSGGIEVFGKYDQSQLALDYLIRLNDKLTDSPFKIAYRVRDEFLIYCYYASLIRQDSPSWLNTALDEMTSMKVLSRIEGDESKTAHIIGSLNDMLDQDFPKSKAKLNEMKQRLETNGYTSFWA